MRQFDHQKFSEWISIQIIGSRSLRKVAEETGVSASMLCRIRMGKRPSLDTLGALCEFMKVPIDTFYDEE